MFNTSFMLCSRELCSHPAPCVPEQCEQVAKPPAGAGWIPPVHSSPALHSYSLWLTVCKGPEECGQRQAGPRTAALDNFNVNFPFILCVKLVLVWHWPLALWGQVLKSDVCLSDRLESHWQCSEIDDEDGCGKKQGHFTSSLTVLLRKYSWISQTEKIHITKSIVVSHKHWIYFFLLSENYTVIYWLL